MIGTYISLMIIKAKGKKVALIVKILSAVTTQCALHQQNHITLTLNSWIIWNIPNNPNLQELAERDYRNI